ncbi:MAG: DUF4416 family protein [Nanoarchaeota archaeon]|nr:DUF4416 family protein [Nanoarchaeota archaeon]MBU0962323.1 DUF4416 family protein [Nanoarchaeota archaeon]
MKPFKPKKVKLFIGLMYKDKNILNKIIKLLENKFGFIQDSIEYDFNYTNYYENEFGKDLKKRFIVFKNSINPELLVNIKLFTNNIENKFSKNNKRLINIDPGYLNKQKLILASAKERYNRIYLKKGIYADLTYFFNKNNCILLRNTFPDFKNKQVQKFFIKIKNSCIG